MAARTNKTTGAPASHADDFERSYGFDFDPFQRRACAALEGGSSVLVAAPTGAGKTVVGEFAAHLALRRGGKTFYTTPIKALSNQKYGDFLALHGPENVGLLTGDNSINGDAPVVVMTTEVLRNMLYEDDPGLAALHYVVLDEVHYLQDRYRGAVWEEILIHLPVDVQTVSLSATVSNAEEFAEWLQTLRGRVEVIIEEERPVDIHHWYFAADELLPMFVARSGGDMVPNPRGAEFDRRRHRGPTRPGQGGRRTSNKRARIPLRSEVVERLNGEGLLPVIYFIFSRRGCDDAVRQCLAANARLTSPLERTQILEYADMRVTDIPVDELEVLGYREWIGALTQGIAAHHAGMIPAFKETVEELFKAGLIKLVFATETLALGINMPARTVVIESLTKFTGERHELMTAGQYTQLSGRAGRRGIDELGHSVVLMQRFTRFDTISRLASTRTYPLNSSFTPSYNMAVNLVRNYDRHDAEHLVNSSFAQFQADRDVVQLERTRERSEAYLASYRERMHCDLGDFREYHSLALRLKGLEDAKETRRAATERVTVAMYGLRPGDVIEVDAGKRRGRYAVVETARGRTGHAPRLVALSAERATVRFAPADFRDPPRAIARVRVPEGFDARDARSRRLLARRLEGAEIERPPRPRIGEDGKELRALRNRVEAHPCHVCPECNRHMHFADRAARLDRELKSIERRINSRTGTLARRFERVLEILKALGYVDDWLLSPAGERLTNIYNEADLLVAESLRRGLLDDLDPPEIAAVLSTLVYETRGPEPPIPAVLPTPGTKRAWRSLLRLWADIRALEEERGLDLTREPDAGYAERIHKWAAGAPLEDVLDEDDAAGDFVRTVKQLVDLLRQVEEATTEVEFAARVGAAGEGLFRGVVAYTSIDV